MRTHQLMTDDDSSLSVVGFVSLSPRTHNAFFHTILVNTDNEKTLATLKKVIAARQKERLLQNTDCSLPIACLYSTMTDRKRQQEIQSLVLDIATTAAVSLFIWNDPGWINPWQLNEWQWILGGLLIKGALTFYDFLVVFVVDTLCRSKLLPTRTTGKPVRYVTLDRQSYIYLTINAVHEWVFVQRYCYFIWNCPEVSINPQDIGLLNTLGGIYVMFVVLDFCYAPAHHIMHMPSLYPLIHKHHHRQHFPTRGYLDAGNEHPIEHLVGILSTWGATFAALYTTGAHGVTLFFFFNIHAALAMLNHSPYNVEFSIIPGLLKYKVANHEMHHRKFTINYAQYCLWYDHLMKTYGPYEGPKEI